MQEKPDIRVRSTVPFKLKNKTDRDWRAFNLESTFGFLPETIIISKPRGMNNVIVLSAVLQNGRWVDTKEEMEKVKKSEQKKKGTPAQK